MTPNYCIRHGGHATGDAKVCPVCWSEQQQRCARAEHDWRGRDGTSVGTDVCDGCGMIREQTAQGVSYSRIPPTPQAQAATDARAQLWARVYAATYDASMTGQQRAWERRVVEDRPTGNAFDPHNVTTHPGPDGSPWTAVQIAQDDARIAADAAARDFDEHYLGGKR